MPKIITNEELLFQIDSDSLYKDLINQLNKDFEIIGTDVDFSETKSPSNLAIFLQEVIAQLLEKHFDTFLNLLYRVDVKEAIIKEIINIQKETMIQEISFLILKREWQKVWYKKYY
ncbi:MAG: hypothetical protein V3U80_00800 [Flavobacteriaceae bacterium]